MILIGRGLDLRGFVRKKNVGGQKRKSWSDGSGSPDLCGFEGAKPGARARKEVGRQMYCRTDGNRKAAAKGFGPRPISGDNSLRDPPVPIPNTEVKPQHADSTWLETAR